MPIKFIMQLYANTRKVPEQTTQNEDLRNNRLDVKGCRFKSHIISVNISVNTSKPINAIPA